MYEKGTDRTGNSEWVLILPAHVGDNGELFSFWRPFVVAGVTWDVLFTQNGVSIRPWGNSTVIISGYLLFTDNQDGSNVINFQDLHHVDGHDDYTVIAAFPVGHLRDLVDADSPINVRLHLTKVEDA